MRLLLMGLSMVLVGCVAHAPDSRMGDVGELAPGRWSATKEARAGIDRNWISRFGDSHLNRLVDEGLRNNGDVKVAAERVNRAAQVAKITGSAGRPVAGAKLRGENQEQKFVGFPFGGGLIQDSYSSSIDISWEVDLWGRIRAGQSADLAEWQAQGQEWRAAQSSLAAQIAKAWFALGEANEQLYLAKEAVGIRKTTTAAIRERFDRALLDEGGTASQLRLAQADVATAQAAVAQWEGERERILRQIEVLVGRYPSGTDLSRMGLPKLPGYPPAGLPSELLLRRPDILAAERRFAGAGKRIKEARLAVYPRLTLNGSLGAVTDTFKHVLDSSAGVWSYGGTVDQSILTGGRLRAEEAARSADERGALANLQQTVLNAFGEVEQALVAERYLAKRLAAVEESARLSKAAAEAAQEDYVEGSGDVLTLLQAQTRRIDVSSQLVSLRRLRLDNRINLHLALGGDYKPRSK